MRTLFRSSQSFALSLFFLTGFLPARAADFGFTVVIQAGRANGSSWEVGFGDGSVVPTSGLNSTNYWNDGSPLNFTMGYQHSNNIAYVDLAFPGSPWQGTFSPSGTAPTGLTYWDLPASNFSVEAQWRPGATSITAGNLQLGSGLNVLQGLSTTSLTVSQQKSGPVTATLAAPVLFTSATGDWLLTGAITFVGLGGNGAKDSDLAFQITAEGTEVAEPGAWKLMLGGMLLIAGMFRLRGKR